MTSEQASRPDFRSAHLLKSCDGTPSQYLRLNVPGAPVLRVIVRGGNTIWCRWFTLDRVECRQEYNVREVGFDEGSLTNGDASSPYMWCTADGSPLQGVLDFG